MRRMVIDPSRWTALEKGEVKAHTRTLPSGKVIQIKAHTRAGDRRATPPRRGRRRGDPDNDSTAPSRSRPATTETPKPKRRDGDDGGQSQERPPPAASSGPSGRDQLQQKQVADEVQRIALGDDDVRRGGAALAWLHTAMGDDINVQEGKPTASVDGEQLPLIFTGGKVSTGNEAFDTKATAALDELHQRKASAIREGMTTLEQAADEAGRSDWWDKTKWTVEAAFDVAFDLVLLGGWGAVAAWALEAAGIPYVSDVAGGVRKLKKKAVKGAAKAVGRAAGKGAKAAKRAARAAKLKKTAKRLKQVEGVKKVADKAIEVGDKVKASSATRDEST